jgi:hypothetical protein
MSAPTDDETTRCRRCDDEDDESEEGDWFSSFLGGFGDADEDQAEPTCDQPPCPVAVTDDELPAVVRRLQQPTRSSDTATTTHEVKRDYQQRTRIVQANMGSMAQCRGDRGELLRRAGAVDALLSTLYEIFDQFSRPSTKDDPKDETEEYNDIDTAILELAIACMGAVRDLACGLALNRSAIRKFRTNDGQTSGLQLLASYLELYHRIPWNNVPRPLHLRLLTNIIGALRNVTHSTPANCLELHRCNVTDMLVWRLLYGEEESSEGTDGLPATTCPWREASFRASATLINMAEKCDICALQCGQNVTLIYYLVDSWGGQKAALLHLGLLAIIRAAKEELPVDQYDAAWDKILANEEDRKRCARQKEEQRKDRVLKRIARGDPYVGEELTVDENGHDGYTD